MTVQKTLNGKNVCPNCNKKIPICKPFCSKECKTTHFEYIKIQLSPKFVKNTLFICQDNKVLLEKEIKRIAKYHNFNEDLTMRKFLEMTEEIKLKVA